MNIAFSELTFCGKRLLSATVILLTFYVTPVLCEKAGAAADGPNQVAPGVTCEVKSYNDKPTLFVNGKPCFPMAYMSYYPEPCSYKQMAKHGVHVYSVSLTLTDKWLGGDKPVKWNTRGIWRGPNDLDLSVVEKSIKEIVEMDPDAIIFPRVYCDSPAWWDKLHPEETDHRGVLGGQERRQSFSSRVWRKDVTEVLKKIVQFVSDSEYADHVIGYMPTVGTTEESYKRSDYSPCAQKQFRKWLLAQCGDDKQKIRRLFGKEIEEISIPSLEERDRGLCGNFYDPEKSQLCIEYRQFYSNEIIDSILAFCHAVKEASGDRLITGIFYGYSIILPETGHTALRRALESEDVDFISKPCGPKSHLDIGIHGFPHFTETSSVLKAGKLFYSEIDVRTSLSQWISKLRPDIDPQGMYNQKRWHGPPTIPDSLQPMKAVFSRVLTNGWANWWFDLWGGWFDDEAFLEMFTEMNRIGSESIHLPRKSVAQIAVVLDENSYRYLRYGAAQHYGAERVGRKFLWMFHQVKQLERVGAPYDFFLLDDLADLDLSQYRMIVFLNAYVLSKDQRRIIRERCMKEDRTLMWLYAPGLIESTLSVDNISSLLGMEVRMEPKHPESLVKVKLPNREITYKGAETDPFFHVVKGADESIGYTSEKRAVISEKLMTNYRNVFASLPPVPWRVLQYFAKKSYVHIYSESGDVVSANESYLAISAAKGGKRMIRLPQEVALKELLALEKGKSVLKEGQRFKKNTTFEINFADHTCRIFQIIP